MRKHMVFLLALVTGWSVFAAPVFADGEGPTVEFKTKLGVSRKVGVKAIQVASTGFSSSRSKFTSSSSATKETETPLSTTFTLAEKSGLSLHIPLKLVKTLKNSKEQTVVTLTDGSEYSGQINGNSLLVTDKNEDYTLSSILNLKVLNPEIPKKSNLKRESWNLFVPIPLEKKFTVHDPSFLQSRKTAIGGFKGGAGANPFGGGPGGAGGPGKGGFGSKSVSIPQGKFAIELDGESVIGNFLDFDRIHIEKQGDHWKMTVQAPGAEPVTGILESDGWSLNWDMPGGYSIGITSQTGLNGFTLSKENKAGGNSK